MSCLFHIHRKPEKTLVLCTGREEMRDSTPCFGKDYATKERRNRLARIQLKGVPKCQYSEIPCNIRASSSWDVARAHTKHKVHIPTMEGNTLDFAVSVDRLGRLEKRNTLTRRARPWLCWKNIKSSRKRLSQDPVTSTIRPGT
jgi:hypothetical protein